MHRLGYRITKQRIKLSDIKRKIQRELSPEESERIHQLWVVIKDYLPTQVAANLEDWERGFMYDVTPFRELVVWENMATVIELAHEQMGLDKLQLLKIILPWSSGDISAMDKIQRKDLLKIFMDVFSSRPAPVPDYFKYCKF